jgi:hypothetical protein
MKEILELKSLISNVDIKLAAASDVVNGTKNQILAVVTIKDLIVFRYVTETADVILKKVEWFQENEKVIQDISFDPSSTWLLVCCLDNTLHVVPALGICDKSISFKCLFTPNEITSFIVPFIGPHECPNPQKCPNHVTETSMDILKRNSGKRSFTTGKRDQFSTSKVDELISGNGVYNTFYCDQKPGSTSMSNSSSALKDSTENIEKVVSSSSSTTPVDSNVSSSNFMDGSVTSSESTISTCPFPTTCLWWKTHYEENRAIIGYSDGCIVVVCEYYVVYLSKFDVEEIVNN